MREGENTLNLKDPSGGSAYGIPVNAANTFPSLDATYLPLMRPSLIRTINSLQELLKSSESNVVNPIINDKSFILMDLEAIPDFVEVSCA